jgi:hypothetical protein
MKYNTKITLHKLATHMQSTPDPHRAGKERKGKKHLGELRKKKEEEESDRATNRPHHIIPFDIIPPAPRFPYHSRGSPSVPHSTASASLLTIL